MLFLTCFCCDYVQVPLNEYEFPVNKLASVQAQLERLVEKNYYLHQSARDAYRSYILAYNSHALKDIFNVHTLDLQVWSIASEQQADASGACCVLVVVLLYSCGKVSQHIAHFFSGCLQQRSFDPLCIKSAAY